MTKSRKSFWLTAVFFVGIGIAIGVAYVHFRSGHIQFAEGRRQYDTGHFDLAADAFTRATQKNPQEADAWYWLGLSWRNLGKPGQAADALQEATRLAPERADWWFDYALALQWAGRSAAAESAWGHTVTLLPPDDARLTQAHIEWARTLAAQGKTDAAVKMLTESLNARPDSQIQFTLAEILAWAGRFDESAAQYRQALASQPEK